MPVLAPYISVWKRTQVGETHTSTPSTDPTPQTESVAGERGDRTRRALGPGQREEER